ncbi:MAG: ABC transporter ATP-binding protein [Dethiosulfovibrio peptidovorans]|nr:MAG: ABC transporter ATP-binding protein [Dethiosulfovibrio peptidovorans]
MIHYFQDKLALSPEGARDFLRSVLWTTVLHLSFMAPAMLAFVFLDERLGTDMGASGAAPHGLVHYGVVASAIFACIYIIAYCQYDSTYTRIYKESAKRRISLAETLRQLPLAFFGKKDVADLSATIMEDVTQIEQLFSHAVPQIYASLASMAIVAAMMFAYDWRLALGVFWVVPAAALVFWMSRKIQRQGHIDIYGIKRDISDKIQEGLDSAQEIRSYNNEAAYSDDLDRRLDSYERYLIRTELLSGSLINLSFTFLKLGVPTALLCGAYLLLKGEVTVFSYLAFLIIAGRIYNPIIDVLGHFALLLYLGVRIDRMKEMDAMPRQSGRDKFNPGNYDIEFKNVDFSYQKEVQTLRNVSFTAKQGEVTALVGPSGGGKSTVAKLSARFWDIDGGVVTLGGQDISKIDPETLLKSYSIVFQDVTLFNASVMENIRLGKKDGTDEEVLRAARLAQCDEFVERLPEGYGTMIGENGERLSGGERQRISIARAILKDAPIILLDEATASLDTENESRIQRALGELIREKTVLVIAHRMRTVAGADKIVVIKDGAVVESGSPQELRDKQGFFASMLEAQMGA